LFPPPPLPPSPLAPTKSNGDILIPANRDPYGKVAAIEREKDRERGIEQKKNNRKISKNRPDKALRVRMRAVHSTTDEESAGTGAGLLLDPERSERNQLSMPSMSAVTRGEFCLQIVGPNV